MEAFSPLDFFVLGVLAFGAWRGFRTGAAAQLVGTIGLVIAFLVGLTLMEPVGRLVVASLGLSERVGPVVGFVVAFAAVLMLVTLAAHVAAKTLQALRLGLLEKGVGAVVGGIRAALGLSLLFLVTSDVALPGGESLIVGSETRAESVLYEPVAALAPVAWEGVRAIAPGVQADLRQKFDAVAGDAAAG